MKNTMKKFLPLIYAAVVSLGMGATAITAAQIVNPTAPVQAGTGLTKTGNTLSVNYGTTAGTAKEGNAVVGVAQGGTGLTSPGTSGYVLTSNGTSWVSSPVSGTSVTSVFGQTGVVPNLSGDVTTSGSSVTTLKNTGTAGTYGQVTTDAQGRVTSGTVTTDVAHGGTGTTSLAANNVLLGNGTSALQTVAPGASGNVLTSNGTTWISSPPAGGGSGTVNSGTAGQMSYYAGTGTAVSGNANATISSGALTLGQSGSTIGQLKLAGNTSGTVTVTPAAAAGTWTMTLPTSGGTNGYYLQTNGSGVTTWAAASGGATILSGYTTSQFDVTTDTSLANVPGLSVNIVSGSVYSFTAVLYVANASSGGAKVAMSGTASNSGFISNTSFATGAANNYVASTQAFGIGGTNQNNGDVNFIKIEGFISCNGSGTLTVQFAQGVASGTSSVRAGSYMVVTKIN